MSGSANAPLLECEGLTKIWCDRFEQRRKYVIRDILFGLPGRDRLRSGERFVLRDFSVTVRTGENVVVMGVPGAGKTTIAKLVTRVLRADAGTVRLGGRVGLVGAGKWGLSPLLTAAEYAELALCMHGAEPGTVNDCREEVLELTGLTEQRNRPIVDLGDSDVRHLVLAAALVVPQDLRVFNGLPRYGRGPAGKRMILRVRACFEQGSNLILSSVADGLPSNLSHVLIVHDGETVHAGDPKRALRIYDKVISMQRRTELGVDAPPPWEPESDPMYDDEL